MNGCRDSRHSRKHGHKLKLWAELNVGVDVHVVAANVPGWQCWTAVGMGDAATGSGYTGRGMGGAITGDGGHAQHKTVGGDGDGGDAGMLGEVSGANTATSTLVYVSTIFKTNTPFLVSSNFIHTCLLAVQQLFSGPTFYMC